MENLIIYFDFILKYLVTFIYKIGYLGIFIGMFLESTFFPMPSEIIMIPAGILVADNKMNLYLVIFLISLKAFSFKEYDSVLISIIELVSNTLNEDLFFWNILIRKSSENIS